MAEPNEAYKSFFQRVSAQGDAFEQPLSERGDYYGFLSKADQDPTTEMFDILFEVVPSEWMENAVVSIPVDVKMPPPPSPASLFHVRDVSPSTVLKVLGVGTLDDVAEGSWYLLSLVKGEGDMPGDLYDPDIDLQPPT